MDILLSIITVNLNNRDGLVKTLESVQAQDAGFYEHIIIDGGSTDGSAGTIGSYRSANRHCTYCVSEKDNGIYAGMNKGIDHAAGDYLLFLNSGDCLLPGILTRIRPLLDGTDLVYGDLETCGGAAGAETVEFPDPPFRATDIISDGFYLPHPATFINRRLFSARRYDENLKIVSDWKFWVECMTRGECSLRHAGMTVSRYDLNGVSTRDPAYNLREREKALEEILGRPVLEDLRELEALRKAPLYRIFRESANDRKFQKAARNLLSIPFKMRQLWKERRSRKHHGAHQG